MKGLFFHYSALMNMLERTVCRPDRFHNLFGLPFKVSVYDQACKAEYQHTASPKQGQL